MRYCSLTLTVYRAGQQPVPAGPRWRCCNAALITSRLMRSPDGTPQSAKQEPANDASREQHEQEAERYTGDND